MNGTMNGTMSCCYPECDYVCLGEQGEHSYALIAASVILVGLCLVATGCFKKPLGR